MKRNREKLMQEFLWARNRFESEAGRTVELPPSLEPERMLERIKLRHSKPRQLPLGRMAASLATLVLVAGAVSLFAWRETRQDANNLSLSRSVESTAGAGQQGYFEAGNSQGAATLASDPYQPVYDCLEELWGQQDDTGWKQSNEQQETDMVQPSQQGHESGGLELIDGTMRYSCTVLDENRSRIVMTDAAAQTQTVAAEVEFTVRSMALWQDRMVLAGDNGFGDSTVLEVYDVHSWEPLPAFALTQDGVCRTVLVTEEGVCHLLTEYRAEETVEKDALLPAVFRGEERQTVPAESTAVLEHAGSPKFAMVSAFSLSDLSDPIPAIAAVLGAETVRLEDIQGKVWLCGQTPEELTLLELECSTGELVPTVLGSFACQSYLLALADESAVLVTIDRGEENRLYWLEKTGQVRFTRQAILQGAVPDRIVLRGDRAGIFAGDREEWIELS